MGNNQATIDWYNKHADEYVKATTKTASKAQINDFSSLLLKGAKVLDAGCGWGRDTNLLYQKGLKPTGMDLSTKMLNQANQKFPSPLLGKCVNIRIWLHHADITRKHNLFILNVRNNPFFQKQRQHALIDI